MEGGHGLLLAILAGICAASASVCAKLAMSGKEVSEMCQYLDDIFNLSTYFPLFTVLISVLRIGIFILTFLFNGLMWTLFTKSLQLCQSSLHATMTNSSSNLIVSGIMGRLLFKEQLSLKWWFGVSLIIQGLMLVNRGQQTSSDCLSDTKLASDKDR